MQRRRLFPPPRLTLYIYTYINIKIYASELTHAKAAPVPAAAVNPIYIYTYINIKIYTSDFTHAKAAPDPAAAVNPIYIYIYKYKDVHIRFQPCKGGACSRRRG